MHTLLQNIKFMSTITKAYNRIPWKTQYPALVTLPSIYISAPARKPDIKERFFTSPLHKKVGLINSVMTMNEKRRMVSVFSTQQDKTEDRHLSSHKGPYGNCDAVLV